MSKRAADEMLTEAATASDETLRARLRCKTKALVEPLLRDLDTAFTTLLTEVCAAKIATLLDAEAETGHTSATLMFTTFSGDHPNRLDFDAATTAALEALWRLPETDVIERELQAVLNTVYRLSLATVTCVCRSYMYVKFDWS